MTGGRGSARSKEELTAALMAPAPSSHTGKRNGGATSSTTSTSSSSTASGDSAVAASAQVATSARHSRAWPFDRSSRSAAAASSSASASTAVTSSKKPPPKLNKNGCLPGCSTFPRCSCRLKSTLKEKLKSKVCRLPLTQLTNTAASAIGRVHAAVECVC